MSTRKGLSSSAGRSVVMAAVAMLVLTIGEPPNATAGPVIPASKGVSATAGASDATGFNAAGLAFMGMAIGTMGTIAAQQNYGYGYGPGYYGGRPISDNGPAADFRRTNSDVAELVQGHDTSAWPMGYWPVSTSIGLV